MPSKLALGLLAAASLGSAASTAQANVIVYKTNYPPVDASAEINGSLGGGTARSFVAAGMMGAKFFGNKNVTGMEASLLTTCQSKTQAGSTWPEGCDFAGLTTTLNSTFAEHWIQGVYDDASQSNAISAQISGLRDYHSPLLAPLYGQADHWVTAYEMSIDSTTFALQNVKFFDGGSSAFADGDTNSYFDGLFQVSGSSWKNLYYQMILSVAGTDPYFHKFLVTFDPPSGVDPRRADAPWKYGMSASPGVLYPGEQMSAELAQERAWNALFAAQVNEDDGMWSAIERSMPGPAWKVAGFAPSGEAWSYYLVPMLDEASSAVALVQLAADDGAFEQIWVTARPRLFLGVTRAEATELAGALLADDEVLQGGELTWDPRAGSHARTPLFPYYELHISDSTGHPRREIIVMLQDGIVHEVRPSSAAFTESR